MTRFEALEQAPIVNQGSSATRGNREWQEVKISYRLDETNEWRRFRPILKLAGAIAGFGIEIDDLRIEPSSAHQDRE